MSMYVSGTPDYLEGLRCSVWYPTRTSSFHCALYLLCQRHKFFFFGMREVTGVNWHMLRNVLGQGEMSRNLSKGKAFKLPLHAEMQNQI